MAALGAVGGGGQRVSYIGRNPAASPATGNGTIHQVPRPRLRPRHPPVGPQRYKGGFLHEKDTTGHSFAKITECQHGAPIDLFLVATDHIGACHHCHAHHGMSARSTNRYILLRKNHPISSNRTFLFNKCTFRSKSGACPQAVDLKRYQSLV